MVNSVSSSPQTDIINALGAGSGIDIKTLATNLTNATKAPQQSLIDAQKSALSAKVSSIGKILSTVGTFADAVNQIGDPKTFQRTPTSNDPSKVTLAFKDGIVPSTFSGNILVKKLASTSNVTFPPMESLDASLIGTTDSSRTLDLSWTNETGLPQTKSIDLGLANSLPKLRDEINKIKGFSASIIQASPSRYYLSVQRGTGLSNQFSASISSKDINGALASPSGGGLTTDPLAGFSQRNGVDAEISVDGISMTSPNNNFNNILPGVSLTAIGETNGVPVTVSSQTNSDGLTTAMATLISGFNTLITTIQQETSFNTDPAKKGGLSGDPVARELLSELRRFTTQAVTGPDGKIHTMAELGISTDRTGTISLNNTKFATVLKTNPEIVEVVLASQREIDDGRLSLSSVSANAQPGVYKIEKASASIWTINGQSATLENGLLTPEKGTNADGLIIGLPTIVSNSASIGYSANIYFRKGLVERFSEMLKNVQDKNSTLQTSSSNASKNLGTLEIKQAELDTKMSKIQQNYITQFTAMQTLLQQNQSTQSSLTNFMSAWTNSLKQ